MASNARFLLIDTAAFIKGVKLERIASEFYTVSEVFDEVRDRQARHILQTFPFDIKIRQPHPDAIKAVVEFAKKTGDFYFLSTTDIKILALTLTLEKEVNGTVDHIRKEPLRQPNHTHSDNSSTTSTEDTTEQEDNRDHEEEKEEEEEPEEPEEDAKQLEDVVTPADDKKELTVDPKNHDDEGWITPNNIAKVTLKMQGEYESMEHTKVGCITTDFAMQNVLLQMGLNLISIDGLRIKKLKQWLLKCQSCNRSTRDMSKVFCPHCGNNTLSKYPIIVDDSGKVIHLNYRPRTTTRGTKYPLPLPKGGKNSKDIILTEEEYTKALRKHKTSSNGFNEQFTFGGNHSKGVVVGYGKKKTQMFQRKKNWKKRTKQQ